MYTKLYVMNHAVTVYRKVLKIDKNRLKGSWNMEYGHF